MNCRVEVRYPHAKEFSKEWGDGKVEIKRENTKHEDNVLLLDSSKSRKMLKWDSLINFNEMISATAKWYKQYYNKEDMLDISIRLIREYMIQAT